MADTNMTDLVRKGYNKSAKNYAAGRDLFKNSKYLEILNQRLKPDSLVLDIGCGNGVPIDAYLENHGHRIIGIDISEKQIELARKNLKNQRFDLKDMSEIDLGSYQVDAVVSFYAIFHIPREQHGELFKKINSFLQVNGLILITLGAGEWEGSEDNFFGAKMYWSQNAPETNVKLLNETGFEILLNEIDETGGEKHNIILAKKIK